jgi:hypothetical protein
MAPLRLLVYDATQRVRPPRALGLAWHAGSYLYRGLGRIDAAFGARHWTEAFDFLAKHQADRTIGELQFWGHGKWGRALIHGESFDRRALASGHTLSSGIAAFRERLEPEALVWFRTCETLGARAGHDFARALADHLNARVAGHTFVIGFFQSGLHSLSPGEAPTWLPSEGIASGSPVEPLRALSSGPTRPNTVTCFDGVVPDGF